MHTKGPWTFKEEKGGGFHRIGIVAKDGRTEFAVGCAAVKFIPDAEALANARLIAAAPELADCLESILKITCGTCEGGDERCVTADGIDACSVAREAKAVLANAREGSGEYQ